VTGLVEFLTARLNEDEQTARAAITPVGDRWRLDRSPPSAEIEVVSDTDYQIVVYDESVPTRGQAEHIVRHDPARVLREVEAKRAILKVHNTWSVVDPEAHYLAEERSCVGCGLDVAGDRMTQDVNKCPVLRALALPHADHPDYREEWRP
jgi:hypothetical protein